MIRTIALLALLSLATVPAWADEAPTLPAPVVGAGPSAESKPPNYPTPPSNIIHFDVSREEAKLIASALAELPYKVSAPVLARLDQQFVRQSAASPDAKKPANVSP